MLLEFGEDEADAAYDVVSGGFVGGEGQELNGEVPGVGAEDEAAFVEVYETEKKGSSAANGVEGALMGAVRGQRVVVAVQDGDGSGREQRVHRGGLLGVCADGEEALPMGVSGGGAGAIVVEPGDGDVDGLDDGGGGDSRLIHGSGGGDDGDGFDGVAGLRRRGSGGVACAEGEGQDLVDGEVLRGQDAVEALEGEGAFVVEKVRDVGLLEAGLLGEAAAGEGAALDAAKEFKAKKFVQILKVHNEVSLTSISFDKTKIRRRLRFVQYVWDANRH